MAAHPAQRWDVGLHYGGTDQSMGLVELAKAAEARGFGSLMVPEHSHIPVSRATPYPGGGEIPGRYLRVWDPLVGLAFVAAQTSMVVGTCICLPGEHDPISFAKAIATMDVNSGGRFVLGVGFGWNSEELEDHGYRAADKYEVVAERVQLMQAIWTQDEASFHGKHVSMDPAWSWPKPLQKPYPPVLVGGFANRHTFRRVAEWGDGWIPMGMDPSGKLDADLAELRGHWDEAGRDPAGPHVMVMQQPVPAPELRELLAFYRDRGVRRVLVDVPTEGADVLVPLLDELAPALA